MNYKCFWLCMLLFSGSVYSQTNFEAYVSLAKNPPSESALRKQVDSLVVLCRDSQSYEEAAKIAHAYSIRFYRQGDYENAIAYGLMEIEDLERLDPLPDTYSNALYNVGLFYVNIGETLPSIAYHKKVIEANLNPTKVAQSYCEIGRAYGALGDYFKALDYYQQGISALEQQEKHRILVSKYMNLAKIHQRINTPENLAKKLSILDKANALQEITYFRQNDHYSLNNSYATYYTSPQVFNGEKAKEYYRKNLERALENEDSTFVSASYINLTDLYNQIRKDSALYFAKQALLYNPGPNHRSLTYYQTSIYYEHRQQWKEALSAIQQTLVNTSGVGDASSETPSLRQLEDASNKITLLLGLTQKAELLRKWYQAENRSEHLLLGLETLKAADQVVDLLTLNSSENQSKLFWRKEAVKVYPLAVEFCQYLEVYDQAFYFAEKAKSLLLLGSIVQNTEQGKLPKNILEKDLTYKREIFALANRKNDLTNEEATLLFEKKQARARYLDSLRGSYPAYTVQNLQTGLLTLGEAKDGLDPNTVVISYVQGEEKTHGLYLTPENQITFSLGEPEALESLLTAFRASVTTPLETQKEWDNYYQTAHDTFQFLFPLEEIRSDIAGKHLIVIPDGNLQSIPFEALIPTREDPKYLLEDTQISYAYSLSLKTFNQGIERNPASDFLGFAPNNFANGNLKSLPQTAAEVHSIQELLGGITFQNEQASKANFMKEGSYPKIIHLATHANASKNPWIAFQDASLELHELYTTRHQADLVVLSACNTSMGEYAAGEGVMGLTRGFFYSGANAVVSSLWNANDKSTATIMEDFYGNLKTGAPKVDALHQAKLNYLKSHSLSENSPYYWAAFVLNGDTQPTFGKSYTIYYVLAIISILGLILIFRNRRKPRNP